MTIVTRSGKGSALSHVEMDANLTDLDGRTSAGWSDMLAPILAATLPGSSAPILRPFGPSGLREEYAFAVNDYCEIYPFHVNHDVMPMSSAHIHMHWSTNGTSTASVKWEFQVMQALGHNQGNFGAPVIYTVEQAAAGTAWRHMVTETVSPIILTEPDELVMVVVRRITNGGTNNTDRVFGLMCDLHYQVDRMATPNRSPNFYA